MRIQLHLQNSLATDLQDVDALLMMNVEDGQPGGFDLTDYLSDLQVSIHSFIHSFTF